MQPEQADFHAQLIAGLKVQDDAHLADMLDQVPAADIAESFELLQDEDRSRILFSVKPHTAAEIVVLLDEAVRGEVVDEMDTESLTEIVSELEPDDAADVLGELPEQEADEILSELDEEESRKIEELLEYDQSTAGGIMTPDVVAVPSSATVADAVEFVRDATPDEELHEIYIVDENRKLIGTVPLRHLVVNPPTTKLLDIVDSDTVIVNANDDQEAVVQIIRKYDASEAAVVDDENHLLGRITHDDLLDVADEEAEEDLLRMAGTDAAELDTSSVFQAARIRLTWLLPCMFGMLLTATVLLLSENNFNPKIFAILAAFAPMLGAMGGNAGIQISTIIIRGFATGDIGSAKLGRALMREGSIALAMAPVCGLLAWGIVSVAVPILVTSDILPASDAAAIARAVGLAMPLAIMGAGMLGILLPFMFRRLGVDPAIASGPLVTTTNDIVSVSIYMLTATVIV